jgi:hypothetical protein
VYVSQKISYQFKKLDLVKSKAVYLMKDIRSAFSLIGQPLEASNALNVGHKTKRYIFVLTTGVVKPKGIFFIALCP